MVVFLNQFVLVFCSGFIILWTKAANLTIWGHCLTRTSCFSLASHKSTWMARVLKPIGCITDFNVYYTEKEACEIQAVHWLAFFEQAMRKFQNCPLGQYGGSWLEWKRVARQVNQLGLRLALYLTQVLETVSLDCLESGAEFENLVVLL